MTHHLHLTGLVQGVGFRPFVWQLAQAMRLCGTVGNGVDGVHIYLNADAPTARHFRQRVLAEAPPLARIDTAVLRETEPTPFADFSITDSTTNGPPTGPLPPDFALCDACRAELTGLDNGLGNSALSRRAGYAFTTCTHCGPRYSILRRIPYDRPATTMTPFRMCPDCQREYDDPANRRFFAQTNSCPNCPVTVQLVGPLGEVLPLGQDAQVRAVVAALSKGQTVAVKGIGGFLLLCDATNAGAITYLRQRKHRPTKPLAVLYPTAALLEQDCHLTPDERTWLTGPVGPIVLLTLRQHPTSGIATDVLAPGLGQLGAMLPYAPLLALVAGAFGKPLVATSGNVSGSPIAYTNEQALTQLPAVADLILTHNRDIVVPQDDSVLRLSPFQHRPTWLRRARGLAPTAPTIEADGLSDEANVLAVGASLKSTFAWQLRGNTYVSQYLGDLDSFDTQTNFRHTLAHMGAMLDATPAALLADQHDGYFSTQLAHELAAHWGVPVGRVQHHEAHLAAVLAENDLLNGYEPVLGVVWDGTGYGTDGHIWGGEFIAYHPTAEAPFERLGHFSYFDALLGDKMPREPRLSALSLAHNVPGAGALLQPKFSPAEWALYGRILAQNRLKTSSVGRLFDAVAALLNLADRVSYEGEAALLLEDRATRYVRQNGFERATNYLPAEWPTPNVPTAAIVAGVVRDVLANVPADRIAANFHATLVQAVAVVARQTGYQTLAFSGGVFQNALLIDWLQHGLGPTHDLHFHRQLPPNDECISYGQLSYASRYPSVLTPKNYVLSHSR